MGRDWYSALDKYIDWSSQARSQPAINTFVYRLQTVAQLVKDRAQKKNKTRRDHLLYLKSSRVDTYTTKFFFNDGTWFCKKNLKWWAQPPKKMKWQSLVFDEFVLLINLIGPFHFVDKHITWAWGSVVLIRWPGPTCLKCTSTSLPEKKRKSPTTTWLCFVSFHLTHEKMHMAYGFDFCVSSRDTTLHTSAVKTNGWMNGHEIAHANVHFGWSAENIGCR